jgi:head-tail adaptor
MIAARLKYQIEIMEKVKVKSSIGSMTETEQLVQAVKADVQTAMGREVANDDRILHSTETTFIIRNWPVVTYSNFIRYKGDKYRIVAIQPLPDRSGQIIKTVRNE